MLTRLPREQVCVPTEATYSAASGPVGPQQRPALAWWVLSAPLGERRVIEHRTVFSPKQERHLCLAVLGTVSSRWEIGSSQDFSFWRAHVPRLQTPPEPVHVEPSVHLWSCFEPLSLKETLSAPSCTGTANV